MKRPKIILISLVPALLGINVLFSQDADIKVASKNQQLSGTTLHQRSAQELSLQKIENNSGGNSELMSLPVAEGMYLNSTWSDGYVVLRDKTRVDNLLIRYDIYNQQMQFVRDEDTLAISRPEEVLYIVFGNSKFICTFFNNNGIIGKCYFELIAEGNCELLLRRTVSYHYDSEEPEIHPDKFLRNDQYYLKKKDKLAEPIQLNRKGVLEAFKDRESAVKEFLKANDLKMKSGKDLKLVVNFYNSLR